MTDLYYTPISVPRRQKSLPLRFRPLTSYDSTLDMHHKIPNRSASRMSFLPASEQDSHDWQAFFQEHKREAANANEAIHVDPFLESTVAAQACPLIQHGRRQSSFAQSVKNGFSAITRRMSFTVKPGKPRAQEEAVETVYNPFNRLTKRRSQFMDILETPHLRPKTRGLFGRRRTPSMPALNLQTESRVQGGNIHEPTSYNQPSIANSQGFIYGGAGARASAAAQNEALQVARGDTPLPPYDAGSSAASDIGDSESGIGISVDSFPRRGSSMTNIMRCDPATVLATELMEHIFSHLDANSVMQAEQVSKQWKGLCQSQVVWKDVFYGEYAMQQRPLRVGTDPSVPGLGKNTHGQNFRKLYQVRKLMDKRWQNGEAAAIYLNGHKDSVYCIQFDEDKIITGSRDNTVRVWDARTYQCLRKLGPPDNARERVQLQRTEVEPHGIVPFYKSEVTSPEPECPELAMWHRASVLCLQYDEDILVTGSSDFSCIVWSIKDNYRPLFRLVGHSAGVLDVCVDSKRIITCSKDTSIKIWNRDTGELIKTLNGHRGPVNAVQVRGNLLASASGDGMSKLWRLEDGICIKEFHSKERGLACVEFSVDGRTIFAGGNDHVIYEYSTITGHVERELSGHKDLVRSLHLDCNNSRIISGSYDHSIKVWDSRRGESSDDGGMKISLDGWTSSWMLAAKSNYRKIACASQDGRVVVVDFGYGIDGAELVEARP